MKNSFRKKTNDQSFPEFFFSLKKLLILGSFIHILATFTVFIIGRFSLFPEWIRINGSMRGDATTFLESCEELSQAMAAGQLDFLYTYAEQIHIRLYTLAYFFFSGLFGSNILTFELINLPLFLSILVLTFKIGEILFNSRVGFISAYALMVFPSFIVHTTQPLRDTLFIAVFLFLIWQLIKVLKSSLTFFQSLCLLVIGSSTFLLLWFVRDAMWPVYLGIIFANLSLVLLINIKNKFDYKFNLIPVSGLLLIAFLTPGLFSDFLPLKGGEGSAQRAKRKTLKKKQKRKENSPFYLRQINQIRRNFSREHKNAGSNIDAGYIFDDNTALIKYIPRAVLIGFFAPFPNLWIEEGVEYGKMGRILSGVEMTIMYFFIFFAVITLVAKRNICVLFIGLAVFINLTALGLVIINVGAIYRMRYVSSVLILILGVKGVFEMKALLSRKFPSVKI